MNEGRFLVYAAVTYLVWEDHRSSNYLQATIYSSARTLKVGMFRVKDKEVGSCPVNPNPLPIERLDTNALFLKNDHQIKGRKGFV